MGSTPAKTIQQYNLLQSGVEQQICFVLSEIITQNLTNAEGKIWHGGPVWFLNGNPIVGYSKQKLGIKLMFWSGADFEEPLLQPSSGKFRDASIIYTQPEQINLADVKRWLEKSIAIQWDYKNIVKRKGKLVKITQFD